MSRLTTPRLSESEACQIIEKGNVQSSDGVRCWPARASSPNGLSLMEDNYLPILNRLITGQVLEKERLIQEY